MFEVGYYNVADGEFNSSPDPFMPLVVQVLEPADRTAENVGEIPIERLPLGNQANTQPTSIST
jgi:hypothetical protein